MIYIHYAIQYNIWAIPKVWTGFEGMRLLIKVATEIPEYWNEQNLKQANTLKTFKLLFANYFGTPISIWSNCKIYMHWKCKGFGNLIKLDYTKKNTKVVIALGRS